MKRMRSWWLAAAACAVLAAALLLPQRFLQQKLDRVAETEFSVDGAELDMEEAVTLMNGSALPPSVSSLRRIPAMTPAR